jgi:glycosyltransferase involved in cell wall biosynthesis
MRILWSLPVRGECLGSGRGDLVRAKKLIDAMRQNGHEVKVVEFGFPPAVSAYRRMVSRTMPRFAAMMVRDAGRWLASIGQGLRAAIGADEFHADAIVETQVGFAFSGAIAAERTGLPLILDDCSPSSEEESLGAGMPWLARLALRRQARIASVIVATSKEIQEGLAREGLPMEKVRLVHNGVDLQAYAGLNREKLRLRMELKGRCIIGFAGSFQPWHAADILIDALDVLRSDPSWFLLLVGDGPHLNPALRELNRLGLGARFISTGSVPPEAVPGLISCFDIGVLPGSNDYGHPMKLLEYAAAGAAIVAPDLPPVRRIVQHFKTGLLFKRGDAEGLAGALRILIGSPELRRRLTGEAQRSIENSDDWSSLSHSLAAAIEPLLSNNRRTQMADSFEPLSL